MAIEIGNRVLVADTEAELLAFSVRDGFLGCALDTGNVFNRASGSWSMIGGSGGLTSLAEVLTENAPAQWGHMSAVILGTATTQLWGTSLVSGSFAGNALDGNGFSTSQVSGAVIGNDVGLALPGVNVHRRDATCEFRAKFLTDDTADIRIFVGFGEGSLATMVGSDAPAAAHAGVRFSTGTDTFWTFVGSDGVSQTTVATTSTPSTTLPRFVRVVADDSVPSFLVELYDEGYTLIDSHTFSGAEFFPGATDTLKGVIGAETKAAAGKTLTWYYAAGANNA